MRRYIAIIKITTQKYFKLLISIPDSSSADDGDGDSEEDLVKDIVIEEEEEVGFNPHNYESDPDSWRRRRAAQLAAGEVGVDSGLGPSPKAQK